MNKDQKKHKGTSMASRIEELEAELHVREIRSRKFSIGKKESNPLTQDLHHAVTSLSAELYTKDVHFLMELIQVFAFSLYFSLSNTFSTLLVYTFFYGLFTNEITKVGFCFFLFWFFGL